MNRLSIYILEDEIITQELLKDTLEGLDYKVCGKNTNAEDAFKEIAILKPDIAILDIRVEGIKTGVWLGNQLEIPFIYLTAFNDLETIKEAIKTKPVSYLVKPFKSNDLFIALELASHRINKEIIVKERGLHSKIVVDDILFAKKEDHYLTLQLKNTKKTIRSSVKEFLEIVNSDNFFQTHRSYIINKEYVTKYSTKEIQIDNFIIPVSNTYSEIIEQYFN